MAAVYPDGPVFVNGLINKALKIGSECIDRYFHNFFANILISSTSASGLQSFPYVQGFDPLKQFRISAMQLTILDFKEAFWNNRIIEELNN